MSTIGNESATARLLMNVVPDVGEPKREAVRNAKQLLISPIIATITLKTHITCRIINKSRTDSVWGG